MNNFETFAKLIAIGVVGGVAKSLFGRPVTVNNVTKVVEAVSDAAEAVKSA